MQINYQLSENDFLRAYAIDRDPTPIGRWAGRAVTWGIGLFLVAMIFGLLAHWDDHIAIKYLPLPSLIFAWFLILEIWPRYAMKQQFRKQPSVHCRRTVTFDVDGAHWRWDGGSSDIAWRNFTRWRKGNDLILLYTSPAGFSIVPTQHLSPGQVEELCRMLNANIQLIK